MRFLITILVSKSIVITSRYVLMINYWCITHHKINRKLWMVWKCRPNILLSVFLISLALPACFTNLYNDILDYALNTSDVTIRSISVPNQEYKIFKGMLLERWGILTIEKGKSSLLSKSLVENCLPLNFNYKFKNYAECLVSI